MTMKVSSTLPHSEEKLTNPGRLVLLTFANPELTLAGAEI
jgi:hypothetical protein